MLASASWVCYSLTEGNWKQLAYSWKAFLTPLGKQQGQTHFRESASSPDIFYCLGQDNVEVGIKVHLYCTVILTLLLQMAWLGDKGSLSFAYLDWISGAHTWQVTWSLKVHVQVTCIVVVFIVVPPFSCCGAHGCFPLSVCHCCLLAPYGSSLVPSLVQLLGESLQQKELLCVTESLPLPQVGIFLVQRDLTQSGWELIVQSSFPVIIVVGSQAGSRYSFPAQTIYPLKA